MLRLERPGDLLRRLDHSMPAETVSRRRRCHHACWIVHADVAVRTADRAPWMRECGRGRNRCAAWVSWKAMLDPWSRAARILTLDGEKLAQPGSRAESVQAAPAKRRHGRDCVLGLGSGGTPRASLWEAKWDRPRPRNCGARWREREGRCETPMTRARPRVQGQSRSPKFATRRCAGIGIDPRESRVQPLGIGRASAMVGPAYNRAGCNAAT